MKKSIQKLPLLLLSILLFVVMIPANVMADSVPSVSYRTHVQNEGWQDWKKDGTMSGTSGKGLRLEGIEVKLDTQGYDLGISYQTHIQNIGWEADTERGWKTNGTMSGTEGLSYRLEAIQIKLTGSDASKFDVYYQVHAQNMGWLGLAKNGESSGTAGYGYRLEGIRIEIVPVGVDAPEWSVTKEDPFYENPLAPYAEIIREYKILDTTDKYDEGSMPNVNLEFVSITWDGNTDVEIYYLLEDLSGDSIPELVISRYDQKYIEPDHPDDYQIYDIYRLSSGLPERVFNIKSMGYRAVYTICEDQIIQMRGSGGAYSWGFTNYYLNNNEVKIESDVYYDRDCVKGIDHYYINVRKDNGVNKSEITLAKFWEVVNSCIKRTDLNWIKL